MRYSLNGKLAPLGPGQEPEEGSKLIQVLSHAEYLNEYSESQIKKFFVQQGEAEYCKAEMITGAVTGTFVIPDKKAVLSKELAFGFYMTTDILIFIDDSGEIEKILEQLVKEQVYDKDYLAQFFFEFMEYLIIDDVLFLQEYENGLAEFEEKVLTGSSAEINHKILHIRRELLIMDKYYQQMTDLSETLESNTNHLFTEEDCRLFALYSKRVGRLYSTAQALKEYTLQIREMYQAQIGVRQNKIMQFLTVVTTIFMPLTLVTGWYGMNFTRMPELNAKYGYLIVIVVSVIIVLVEIWIFKAKKWFN